MMIIIVKLISLGSSKNYFGLQLLAIRNEHYLGKMKQINLSKYRLELFL